MIRLFYNYYEDKNPNRKREIDLCLNKNLDNRFVNTIIIESQKRLNYNYFFERINLMADDDDISIVCNSDIYFDDTICLSTKMRSAEAYALTRWDLDKNGRATFLNRRDSQDTWIFKGKIKPIKANFALGVRGCDNRIAYEIKAAGYALTNPSLSIKTYHVHYSNIRNYGTHDVVPEPYLTIDPIRLP